MLIRKCRLLCIDCNAKCIGLRACITYIYLFDYRESLTCKVQYISGHSMK